SKEERAALESVAPAPAMIAASADVSAGRRRALREHVQASALGRLSKELPVPPSFLPQLFEDAAQPSAIKELAKRVG
ncbi:MAG TPA: hypothetical protein VM925_14970, partial [Labilithrix sp.]|nr:hypothetical protein [Labilithrix sp.]